MENRYTTLRSVCTAQAQLPTSHGAFEVRVYRSENGIEHLALLLGDPASETKGALVRIHSECITGDVFGSLRCDCGSQLNKALQMIGEAGAGICIYLRDHEGRGVGLTNKVRCYALQEQGHDTVEANQELGLAIDARDYTVAANILKQLSINNIRLITNNPSKYQSMSAEGITVVQRVPLPPITTAENRRYLMAKKEKLGHWIDP